MSDEEQEYDVWYGEGEDGLTGYTMDEAQAMVSWLSSDTFKLLDRRFAQIRRDSVDSMDSGFVTMDSAETLVRASAQRRLIADIRGMAAALAADIKRANDEARIEIS
ncbi:MAG TPA: hypothetical protein VMY98_01375 [Anaerolineae bacterium]|nr:hypothetical protein [Anaerolineae bacterium]